jgi:hypothetical protein
MLLNQKEAFQDKAIFETEKIDLKFHLDPYFQDLGWRDTKIGRPVDGIALHENKQEPSPSMETFLGRWHESDAA